MRRTRNDETAEPEIEQPKKRADDRELVEVRHYDCVCLPPCRFLLRRLLFNFLALNRNGSMSGFRPLPTVGLVFSSVIISTMTVTGAGPNLDDVWTGKAQFEVEQSAYGIEFGMHFLSSVVDQDTIYVFHNTPDSGENSIGLATTTDGVMFKNLGKVLTRNSSGWDGRFAAFPGAAKVGDKWFLTYEGAGDSPGDLGLATSDDGVKFTKHQTPILVHGKRQTKDSISLPLSWERTNVGTPSIYFENDKFYVFYHGFGKSSHGGPDDCQLGLATGTDLTQLKRAANNPILKTSKSGWDSGTIGKRSIVKQGDYYYMVYEGSTDQPYDKAKWSSGLARAKAITGPWEKFNKNPVIPATPGGFGYDGPEWMPIGEKLYLYYRAPTGPTSRATLVWK